jgi:hypothetical protein
VARSALSVVAVTAADFAVSPTEVRRAAAAFPDAGPPVVPELVVDAGWAATDALESVIVAAARGLAGIAAADEAVAGALDSAARAYERCDEDAAERIRAALRSRDG